LEFFSAPPISLENHTTRFSMDRLMLMTIGINLQLHPTTIACCRLRKPA
jgi:hypothetical protein